MMENKDLGYILWHSQYTDSGDVQDIRLSSLSTADLARRYGMDWSTVKDARVGVTWKHVLPKGV